jgi:UPF0755 protein
MGKNKNRFSRKKIWAVTWLFLLLFGAGYTAFDIFIKFPSTRGPGIGRELEVEILPGMGPGQIGGLLEEKGIISDAGKFRLWLRAGNMFPHIKAGLFILQDDMTPVQIVDKISGENNFKGVRVTILEGAKISEMAQLFEKNGIVTAREFIKRTLNRKFLASVGINASSAEGFLFPDTYYFDLKSDAEDVIVRMYNNFKKKLNSLNPPDNINITNVVILASIVQAEAQHPDEAAVIAGVYTNRLNRKLFPSGLLQADPTVAYGCDPVVKPHAASCLTFKGVLGSRQLQDEDNLYNTYRHSGLPPGPICSPGIVALKAAIWPEEVPYLYFVAYKKGRHKFSVTLSEHNKAVKLYRKQRSNKN